MEGWSDLVFFAGLFCVLSISVFDSYQQIILDFPFVIVAIKHQTISSAFVANKTETTRTTTSHIFAAHVLHLIRDSP